MDCSNVQSILDPYLDGELDVLRNSEVKAHLDGCNLCARSFNESQMIRRALKSESLDFKAPADMRRRVQYALRQAAKAEAPSRRFSSLWFKIGAPIAAAALVVFMVAPNMRGPSSEELLTQEIVASHIRSLMVDHLTDVPSSDEHTVKPWFNGKLTFSPPASDLANDNFPLVGGRLDYINNRPVAALVYERDKHIINVFVWPSDERVKSVAPIPTRQGYHVIRWVSSGMNFSAVSDLEQNQLVKFADLIKLSTAKPAG